MNLSILMVTKDADGIIDGTLKSINGLWDELLVDDESSSDRTELIITKYGGKVYHSGLSTFGKRRNWLLNKAQGKWILFLDSDEIISSDLKISIEKAIKTPRNSKIVGYWISHLKYAFGKQVHFGGESYSLLRLFMKKHGRVVKSFIHEEVIVDGSEGKLQGYLIHHSYRTFLQTFQKFSYYAWLAAGQKKKDGEHVTLKKLTMYGPHMFWARAIKDQGYRDGWRGIVLALFFAYMEGLTYWLLLFRSIVNM